MWAFFVLFWIFSLAGSIFLVIFWDYRQSVKMYGTKDYVRDWIERKRNLYFYLFIWSFNLAGSCWLVIIFLSC